MTYYLRDVFDQKTGDMLENISSANSIPPEFLLPPFLAACGHFLGKSVVCPWGTWKQPAIIYSTTVGFTGTNKSAAIEIIKGAIQEVESAQGIPFQNSRINQSATVESLLKQLTQENRQIMMWDELKTWQTSLGLYKSGSASDYDTTIYLTAYNGGSLKRQTCNSNTAIPCPVLNLTGMSHPGEICKRLDEERKTSDNNDGLYSRFLMCMPEPVFSFADEVQEVRQDLPSLAKLFYAVEKMNVGTNLYTYGTSALAIAKQYYNDQQTFLKTNHQNDTFLS
ncbi:uncharacterized protein LOC134244630, partial [Saccostrea cucullata]|uniref:uncharacterized protein LOC134244630 n=1 Tax=Saccostrea cuccullata TaxID=36930 RepID=UPI002ED33CA4